MTVPYARWQTAPCRAHRDSSSDRQPCNRIGMNARTVDQREFGSLFVEGQCEICTPQHDRLPALVPEQTVARGIEDRTLILSHKARRGHRNVCLMHIVQIRLAWRNDLR